MEAALYDPDGRLLRDRRSGRRAAGQFLTSPEVGPLFGAVLARALDTWWEDAAAGRRPSWWSTPGRGPARWPAPCWPPGRPWPSTAPSATSPSERSAAQRATHAGLAVGRLSRRCRMSRSRASCWPTSCSTTCPSASPSTTAAGGRRFVDVDPDGASRRGARARSPRSRRACRPSRRTAPRAPVQDEAVRWVRDVVARLRPAGRLVVIDYTSYDGRDGGAAVAGVAADLPRPPAGRALPAPTRARRTSPATSPSTSSRPPTTTSHPGRLPAGARPGRAGRGGPADVGRPAPRRPTWPRSTGRSRVREAEALTDPAGLGGFTVAEWVIA